MFMIQGIGTKIFDTFRKTVISLDPQPKRICCATRENRVVPFLKFGFMLVERMVEDAPDYKFKGIFIRKWTCFFV